MTKAEDVQKLREMTGAGVMDSKNALQDAEGDFDKAIAILRKKGQKIAEKRADRDSSEGAVIAAVNDAANKGAIVSLNCETDFVAKTDDFKNLCRDVCLHIAAASPSYVTREEVPEEEVKKEQDIAAAQAEGKPAPAVQKIVEGKLNKYYSTICLLEQPFVKNSDQTIQDLLTAKISALGENLVIQRFVRYQIGE